MPRRCVPRGRLRHRLPRAQAGNRALTIEPRAWVELALDCDRTGVEAVCEILEAAGAVSVTLEDAGDEPQLEPGPGAMPLWPSVRVRALYEHRTDMNAVRSALRAVPEVSQLRLREIAERDWLAAAREDIEPIEIGTLWVGPQWAVAPPGRTVVRLEPGLAFGSGRHPTTRLCLERLAAAAPAGEDVVDYGCGSGILAVAAAALGARRVLGIDIDPQALEATAANARINGVSDRVCAVAADTADTAASDIGAGATLVVANILAGPLIELAPVLGAMTRPGGGLALSGILDGQTAEVADAYRDAFEIHSETSSDGWVRLDGRRRTG